MAARFLFNEALWLELAARLPKAQRAQAAVAYLGSGGAKLLPLRKGDQLVVDMSLRCVRAGATDPREIRKFLRRGVEVFSRASLHAKFFILDRTVIAGSSNVSRHAHEHLDEAAVLSDDAAVLARARETFRQISTEPVRKDYLEQCLKNYRPPAFAVGMDGRAKHEKGIRQGKLWIIGGLRYLHWSPKEEALISVAVDRAAKHRLAFEDTNIGFLRYTGTYKFFGRIRRGDWIISCISDGRGFNVEAPARFLGHEIYRWSKSKIRHVLVLECPGSAKDIRWTTFRASARAIAPAVSWTRPRTGPIVPDSTADGVLGLWDVKGRFTGRKR